MDERKMMDVAWIGDDVLRGTVSGVLLSFHGLGYTGDKAGPDTIELELVRSGWLVVFPY
jgi:hypothetical protein